MDEQLKQRLIGATIIVALSVIFVPMLFEDKNPPAGTDAKEVQALPEAIEEKAIELPKSAADVAQQEKKDDKTAEAGTNYRVIPLEDPPPKAEKALKSAKAGKAGKTAKTEPVPETAAPPADSTEVPMEDEFATEDQEEPPEKPAASGTRSVKPANAGTSKTRESALGKSRLVAKQTEPQALDEPEADEEPSATLAPPEMPAVSKFKATPAKPAAKKPEKSKLAETPPKYTVRPELPRPLEPAMAFAGPKHAPLSEKSKAAETLPLPKPATAKPSAPAPKSAVAAKTQDAKQAGVAHDGGKPAAWMVQAGSFASEANAHALVDKLRKRNVPAVVDVIQGGSGTLYRVRVGPDLNRARAEQIRQQIEHAAGIKSLILPHK